MLGTNNRYNVTICSLSSGVGVNQLKASSELHSTFHWDSFTVPFLIWINLNDTSVTYGATMLNVVTWRCLRMWSGEVTSGGLGVLSPAPGPWFQEGMTEFTSHVTQPVSSTISTHFHSNPFNVKNN